MRISNPEVAEVLHLTGDLLEIRGGPDARKAAAYRRAARSVAHLGEDVTDLVRAGRLREIPGVGEALAKKIRELAETGRLAYHDRLREGVPAGVLDLLKVPGVGARTAGLVWRELGVDGLEALEEAARSGRLASLPGLGPKKVEAILNGLAALRRRSARVSLGVARPTALALVEAVERLKGVDRAVVAGSVRRWCETVGDINIVARLEPGYRAAPGPGVPGGRGEEAADTPGGDGAGEFPVRVDDLADLPPVQSVDCESGTALPTALLRLGTGLEARVSFAPSGDFWPAVRHITGSAGHNEKLAERARALGLDLAPDGRLLRDGEPLPAGSEEEFYGHLDLPLIPPELREGGREVEAAAEGRLPRLVERADIRGDLHVHSNWSDGGATLEELARAGRALGYEYVVVSDHSKSLAMAGGLDEKRLLQQREEIERINRELGAGEGSPEACRLVAGVEVDILAGGELDLPDSVLAEMEFVTASIHSRLRAPGAEITERLVSALENEHVDCLAHPTGRLLGRRDPSEVDLEAVIDTAARTGTFLEINASPDRLDLKAEHAALAREAGCLLTISTDAHSLRALDDMAYGVATARRAWLEAGDVVNTRSWPEVARLLGKGRPGPE